MRLYEITEDDIMETLKHPDSTDNEGKYQISLKHFLGRFSEFPLKVVYAIEDEEFIVSAYPLKKAFRRKP